MGHHELQARCTHRLAEDRSGFRVDRRHRPLVDVAGENLEALAAGLDSPLDSAVEAAGDRVVGPEHQGWGGASPAGHGSSS